MIADTSDIRGLSAAHRARADELTSAAAHLRASTVATDAFGTVGAGFVAALNAALTREACQASHLAERFAAAQHVAGTVAASYDAVEERAGQTISRTGP